MTNLEKQELRRMCRAGYSFEHIRLSADCSDATIRRYMKVFSPKMDEVVPKPDNTEELREKILAQEALKTQTNGDVVGESKQ